LANAAQAVFESKVVTAAQLREALTGITPGDQEFRAAFETTRVSNARLARYYLRSLEMTAKDEAEPWFVQQNDRTIINLEHILPRKPQSNWPQFSEDEVRLYTTRLGNLALMLASDNSELKSEAFVDKRTVYGESPYLLTSEIAEVDLWTGVAIAQRQTRLAELAVKTWPV